MEAPESQTGDVPIVLASLLESNVHVAHVAPLTLTAADLRRESLPAGCRKDIFIQGHHPSWKKQTSTQPLISCRTLTQHVAEAVAVQSLQCLLRGPVSLTLWSPESFSNTILYLFVKNEHAVSSLIKSGPGAEKSPQLLSILSRASTSILHKESARTLYPWHPLNLTPIQLRISSNSISNATCPEWNATCPSGTEADRSKSWRIATLWIGSRARRWIRRSEGGSIAPGDLQNQKRINETGTKTGETGLQCGQNQQFRVTFCDPWQLSASISWYVINFNGL